MTAIPQDFISAAMLVFVLGLKHGFDADHLATIDGLTRFNQRHNPHWARLCGTLFSLGHGAVVVAIALGMSLLASHSQTPEWLSASGAWISIGVLTALGVVNLYAVFSADPHQVVAPVGIKGRIFGRLNRIGHPLGVALVGSLFALSFDTVSQAALFAVTAAVFGGWEHALALGLIFMLGMLVTDGVNGLWISRLIRRADETARIASRVMSLAVSGMSLLVAALGALKIFSPQIDEWSEGKELIFGSVVMIVIVLSFLIAIRLVRVAPEETASRVVN